MVRHWVCRKYISLSRQYIFCIFGFSFGFTQNSCSKVSFLLRFYNGNWINNLLISIVWPKAIIKFGLHYYKLANYHKLIVFFVNNCMHWIHHSSSFNGSSHVIIFLIFPNVSYMVGFASLVLEKAKILFAIYVGLVQSFPSGFIAMQVI